MKLTPPTCLLTIAFCAVVDNSCGGFAALPSAKLFAQAAPPRHGEFEAENVKVRNANREYRLVVPKTVDLSKPAQLVIAFHGMLIDSKDLMPKYTRLNRVAEKHEFILAYPAAIGRSWGIPE